MFHLDMFDPAIQAARERVARIMALRGYEVTWERGLPVVIWADIPGYEGLYVPSQQLILLGRDDARDGSLAHELCHSLQPLSRVMMYAGEGHEDAWWADEGERQARAVARDWRAGIGE